MLKLMRDTTVSQLALDDSEGLGRLSEATSAKVTEERNGIFTLTFNLPTSARHFAEIRNNSVILAKPNPYDDPQMFRVYKSTKPLNGIVTFYCNHISYDLNKTSVLPFSATSAPTACAGIMQNMIGGSGFTITTDKVTIADFKNEIPQSARSLLGGQEGSLLDTYKGEFKFDNLTVSLLVSRGIDSGVRIAYGKNLTDINQEENIEQMFTAVLPFVKMSDADSAIVGDLITITAADEPRIMNLDLSNKFQQIDEITTAMIAEQAAIYISQNSLNVPKINIKVSFVNLADTEEYKHIADLERVHLCDLVTVEFPALGVNAKAKVIKTVYDVLNDRYESIELGDVATGLARTVSNIISNANVQAQESRKFTQSAIEKATALISGGLGGYVVMGLNQDGKPEEILIMDTPDKTTAVNVIRMNLAGIGFSTHGYNGPFDTAWNINGSFVADYIKAGTLDCQELRSHGGDAKYINASQLSTGTMDNDRAGGYNFSSGNDITVVNWDGWLCHYYFDHGIGMDYWLEYDTSTVWYRLYNGPY